MTYGKPSRPGLSGHITENIKNNQQPTQNLFYIIDSEVEQATTEKGRKKKKGMPLINLISSGECLKVDVTC